MKVLCDGLDLSDAALKVSKALAGKSIDPILEGIKITAKEDTLTLFATDKSLSIEKSIKANVFMEGEIVVIGKTFVDFVKRLEGEQVELSTLNEGQLVIKYTDSETKINVLNVDDYPKISKDINEDFFIIKTTDFKDLVEKTVFACIQDDSRPVLKGCLFEIEDGFITSVALDGYRMAKIKKQILQTTNNLKAIIPSKTLNEITRILDLNIEEIKVYIEKNNIKVEVGDTKLYSRLIEGDYINYKSIIPKNFNTNVVVNKQLLLNSVERAAVVARSARSSITKLDIVKFDIKENSLNVQASSDDGEVNEALPINLTGKDILIGFSSKNILEYLKYVDDEFVSIDMISNIDACIFKPYNDEEYIYLLLPMKIQ